MQQEDVYVCERTPVWLTLCHEDQGPSHHSGGNSHEGGGGVVREVLASVEPGGDECGSGVSVDGVRWL
jgi:hypothetical protein